MQNKFISIPIAILATLLYIIGIELLGSWFYLAEAIKFNNYIDYYLLIQGAVQFIAVVIFIYLIKNKTLKNLIKKTNPKWYLLALLLGISFVFIQSPLKWIYNFLFDTEYYIAYRFDGFPTFKNINIISSILLIPISEELFFREYIQNYLQKKLNVFLSIIIASLLFASIHSPYLNLISEYYNQDWHSFYLTIFGGIISGVLYYKSKSIGPSMVYHIFWNLVVIIV